VRTVVILQPTAAINQQHKAKVCLRFKYATNKFKTTIKQSRKSMLSSPSDDNVNLRNSLSRGAVNKKASTELALALKTNN
jgi:hypothetical protein